MGLNSGISGASGAHGWVSVAQTAKHFSPGQLDRAEAAVAGLPIEEKQRAERLLTQIAQAELSPVGVVEAVDSLRMALPTFANPESELGGDDPAVAAVKLASLCVLEGLLVRAGEHVASQPNPQVLAVALVRAVRTIDVLGAGGQAKLIEEVRMGLGRDLYIHALRTIRDAEGL